MQRWETRTALAAVIVGSASALPVRGRTIFAGVAILLIAVVALSRLRASLARRPASRSSAAVRAAKIREGRSRIRRP